MHSFKGYGKVDGLDQTRLEAKRKKRRRIIIISISTVVLVAIIAAVAVGVVRLKKTKNDESGMQTTSKAMKAVCDATRYPDVCVSSLSSFSGASNAGPKDLVHIAVEVAMEQVQKSFNLFTNLTEKTADPTLKAALQDCEELMDQTMEQLNSSNADLKNFSLKSLREPAGDVKTWLSAALTNLDTCFDGFENSTSSDVRAQVQTVTDNLSKLISNSLAIVNSISDLLAKLKLPFPSRRLLSKEFHSVEDGFFPKWLSVADRKLLQAVEIVSNVTVAADGSGKYRTIQEAVDAAPEKSKTRFIIKVAKGTYKENVVIDKKKTMIMMIGDGMDNTIVTGDKNVVDGTPTFRTATFAAVGNGFIAVDMQFTNTAGPSKHQAVALRVGSDESICLRCKITAYQDTLYAHSQRQFYRDCYISGTVDFIFGNAAVVLQNCTLAARRPDPNQQNIFTAQGRTDPGQTTGISIHHCSFIGEKDLTESTTKIRTYLGRPWKEYSRTVIMLSEMSNIIEPAGWLEWNGDFALSTLQYGEYMNTGPGAGVTDRVKWAGYKVITSEKQAQQFTVAQFIGSSWLSSSGVAVSYTEGLNA